MSGELAAGVAGAVLGVVSGAIGPAVIRRLPEPELDTPPPDGEEEPGSRLEIKPVYSKTSYAELGARPRLAVTLAVLATAAGVLLGLRLGWSDGLLVALTVVPAGTWLAYVDVRTTFLPTALIYPTLLLAAVVAVGAAAVAGSWDDVQRAAIGCALYGGIFYLLWFLVSGFGFGDVRLAFLLGLVLGYLGWAELATGFLLAQLLGGLGGALLALARVIDPRRNPFGPWMLAAALIGAGFGPALASGLGY